MLYGESQQRAGTRSSVQRLGAVYSDTKQHIETRSSIQGLEAAYRDLEQRIRGIDPDETYRYYGRHF